MKKKGKKSLIEKTTDSFLNTITNEKAQAILDNLNKRDKVYEKKHKKNI